jgi:phage I-like protein
MESQEVTMNARAATIEKNREDRQGNASAGTGTSSLRASTLGFPNHFATLLSASGASVEQHGKTICEIPIAVTGRWVKRGCEFSITLGDLEAMVRNFVKRKNEQVVIDYEHASETPEVALGGPVPAAGWIHALSLVRGGSRPSVAPRNGAAQGSNSERAELHARIEWTAEARQMIHDGQYRFFSPAIDWNTRNKETGQPQGATLTSGALTNHPFLEELPPIMLTDLGGSAAILAASSRKRPDAGGTPAPPEQAEGETFMKQLTLKPITEGPQAGHHGVFDGDDPVGFVDAGEFSDYARQHLDEGSGDPEASAECPSQRLAERIGVAPATTFDELRRRLAVGADAEAASTRAVLLREAAKDGVLDCGRAAVLAREGRITLSDYIAAEEADRKLDEAVRAGKILPRDRKFFFRDALERPREFAEYVRQCVPRVPLGSVGLASGGSLSVDDEVKVRAESLMAEQNLSYSKALKRVFASDRELAQRYHAEHRQRLVGDAGGESPVPGITQ